MNTIECHNFERFMEVVVDLQAKGCAFKANAEALTVTITGV